MLIKLKFVSCKGLRCQCPGIRHAVEEHAHAQYVPVKGQGFVHIPGANSDVGYCTRFHRLLPSNADALGSDGVGILCWHCIPSCRRVCWCYGPMLSVPDFPGLTVLVMVPL